MQYDKLKVEYDHLFSLKIPEYSILNKKSSLLHNLLLLIKTINDIMLGNKQTLFFLMAQF